MTRKDFLWKDTEGNEVLGEVEQDGKMGFLIRLWDTGEQIIVEEAHKAKLRRKQVQYTLEDVGLA